MKDPRLRICICALMLIPLLGQSVTATLSFGETVDTVADRLEAYQVKAGDMAGSWPGEDLFTGAIVAGMVSAYELRCDTVYEDAAKLGASYILWSAQGNFLGDEAFALTRLSDIADDPCDNLLRTVVEDFYFNVEHDVNGTAGYISEFAVIDPSTAVFYIAYHTVAAYYVDANDKQIWRNAVIDYIAQVDDDSAYFPVLALGVATWSLARTGPLDNTLVDPNGTGRPYWSLVKLSDLPDILLSHQVPPGDLFAGSFYWRFDHGHGGTYKTTRGYTEDSVFAALALLAASEANPALDLDAALLLVSQALFDSIGEGGEVYPHMSQFGGGPMHLFGGEMLQALGALAIPGDLNLDGAVNQTDFAIFAGNWCSSGCTKCSWCSRADLNHDGQVDYIDLRTIVANWLKRIGP